MKDNDSELKNIVEAALLAAEEPLSLSALVTLFPEDAGPTQAQLKETFEQLERDYEGRGVELRRVGKGWRFQSREKYSPWLRKLTESRPPRYSRAFLETLAIIAYRQPVTRGDIEEIRGVQVSSDIMRSLIDRDWVKEVGHRDVPGRPALLGTTQQFLEYFNLEALSELPPLLERREASDIARELNLRLPLEGEGSAIRQDGVNDAGGSEATQDDLADPDEPGAVSEEVGAQIMSIERQSRPAMDEETTPAPENPDVEWASAGDTPGSQTPETDQESARAERDEEDRDNGGESPETEDRDEEAPEDRPTAQVIPFDDALTSREGDGENS